MLKLWGRTSSINVQKVVWCCAELGLHCQRIEAGREFGVVDTPEYLAMNPNALVPTIEDDGFILWESNVIVRYLCHKHSSGTLYPSEARERFTAEKWMEWQGGTMWPSFRDVFWGLVRTPPEERDHAAIERAQKQTAKRLAALETALGQTKYVAGDRFTMGDIPLGVSLRRCFQLGIAERDFPNIARWYGRLGERPAFREYVLEPALT
jgi:glutathione S-transferase